MEWFVTSWLGRWTWNWEVADSSPALTTKRKLFLGRPYSSVMLVYTQLRLVYLPTVKNFKTIVWGGVGAVLFCLLCQFFPPSVISFFFLSRMRESYVRVAKHIGHYKWSLKVDFRLRASGYRKRLRSRKPAVWYSLEWYIEEKRQLIGVLCQIYQATKQASNQSKTLFYLEFLDSKGGREYFREYFRG